MPARSRMSKRSCGVEWAHLPKAAFAAAIAASTSDVVPRANSPTTSLTFEGLMLDERSVESTGLPSMRFGKAVGMRRSWQFCTIARLPFSPRAADADGEAVICFEERRSRLWISGRNFARRGRTGVCRSKLSREPFDTAAGARCHRAKRCRGASTTSLRPRVRPRLRARGRAESRPDGARLLRPVRAAGRFRTRAAAGRQEDSGGSLRGSGARRHAAVAVLAIALLAVGATLLVRAGKDAPARDTALVGTSGGSAPTTASGDSAAPVPARAAERPAPPAPPPAHPLTILIQTSGPCWVSATADDRRVLYRLLHPENGRRSKPTSRSRSSPATRPR